jgi:hypothetical protein
MGMFDPVGRFACKLGGGALFRWVLRREPALQVVFDSWEDTRRLNLPGQPDRTNDLVAILRPTSENDSETRAIVEVQAEPEKWIFARLGIYQLLLIQEVDSPANDPATVPAVHCVLLNLTGESPPEGWHSPPPGISVRPIVVNFRNESAAHLLDEVERGELDATLLPWVPLMRGGGEPEVMERWKQLGHREPSAERRGLYRDLALIFAELSKKLVLWQKALEGWEMVESQLILGWLKQGNEQGRVENARANVLQVIAVRLEDPVPEDLMLAIEGTNDPSILSEWLVVAATSKSIGELRKAMKKT